MHRITKAAIRPVSSCPVSDYPNFPDRSVTSLRSWLLIRGTDPEVVETTMGVRGGPTSTPRSPKNEEGVITLGPGDRTPLAYRQFELPSGCGGGRLAKLFVAGKLSQLVRNVEVAPPWDGRLVTRVNITSKILGNVRVEHTLDASA